MFLLCYVLAEMSPPLLQCLLNQARSLAISLLLGAQGSKCSIRLGVLYSPTETFIIIIVFLSLSSSTSSKVLPALCSTGNTIGQHFRAMLLDPMAYQTCPGTFSTLHLWEVLLYIHFIYGETESPSVTRSDSHRSRTQSHIDNCKLQFSSIPPCCQGGAYNLWV